MLTKTQKKIVKIRKIKTLKSKTEKKRSGDMMETKNVTKIWCQSKRCLRTDGRPRHDSSTAVQ